MLCTRLSNLTYKYSRKRNNLDYIDKSKVGELKRQNPEKKYSELHKACIKRAMIEKGIQMKGGNDLEFGKINS